MSFNTNQYTREVTPDQNLCDEDILLDTFYEVEVDQALECEAVEATVRQYELTFCM